MGKINFSDFNFDNVVEIEDLDDSMFKVQEMIGIDDGGVCGIYWSGIEDKWVNGTKEERLQHIEGYIKLENTYLELSNTN